MSLCLSGQALPFLFPGCYCWRFVEGLGTEYSKTLMQITKDMSRKYIAGLAVQVLMFISQLFLNIFDEELGYRLKIPEYLIFKYSVHVWLESQKKHKSEAYNDLSIPRKFLSFSPCTPSHIIVCD